MPLSPWQKYARLLQNKICPYASHFGSPTTKSMVISVHARSGTGASRESSSGQRKSECCGLRLGNRTQNDVKVPPAVGDVEVALTANDVEAPPAVGDVGTPPGAGDVEALPGTGDVEAPSGAGDVEAPPGAGDVEASPGMGDVDVAPAGH